MSHRWSCDCSCPVPLSYCAVSGPFSFCDSLGAGDCPSTIVANVTLPELPFKRVCCSYTRHIPWNDFSGPFYCDYTIIDDKQYPADTLDVVLTNTNDGCSYTGYVDIDYVTTSDCDCSSRPCPKLWSCSNYSYASIKRRITVEIRCCGLNFLYHTPCGRPELETCQDTEGGATYYPCCGVAGAISHELSTDGTNFYGVSWSFTWKAADNPSISECTDKCPCLSQFGTPIEHSVGVLPEYQGWSKVPNQYGFGPAVGAGDVHQPVDGQSYCPNCCDSTVGGSWFLGTEYPVASLNSLS